MPFVHLWSWLLTRLCLQLSGKVDLMIIIAFVLSEDGAVICAWRTDRRPVTVSIFRRFPSFQFLGIGQVSRLKKSYTWAVSWSKSSLKTLSVILDCFLDLFFLFYRFREFCDYFLHVYSHSCVSIFIVAFVTCKINLVYWTNFQNFLNIVPAFDQIFVSQNR